MATHVYTTKEIILQDDTEVTLRPLPVGRLRRLMKEWKKFEELGEDEESYDIFVSCAGIALEKDFSDKFESTAGVKGDPLSKEYRAYLEDTLDMDTIYEILEVCAGMKLNDPNLLAAAAQAVQDGTN